MDNLKYIIKFILIAVMILIPGRLFAKTVPEILVDLQNNMQGLNSVQADFLQTKHLQIFSKPLVIKGTLYLQKPDKFSWRTRQPMRYNMTLAGETIRQWDSEARQVQEFSLNKNPAFQAALAQMKGWFDGNYAAMAKDYDIAFKSDVPLILIFTPKNSSMTAGLIARIEVIFRQDRRYITGIKIEEKNGDMTTIDFSNIKLDSPINSLVWEVKSRV